MKYKDIMLSVANAQVSIEAIKENISYVAAWKVLRHYAITNNNCELLEFLTKLEDDFKIQ